MERNECAFADIRNRYTELTAATARIPIQTPKKTDRVGCQQSIPSAKKLLTVSHVGAFRRF
jgi:hypothetical protein